MKSLAYKAYYARPSLDLYKVLTKAVIRSHQNFIKILALRGFIRNIFFFFNSFYPYDTSSHDVQENDFS